MLTPQLIPATTVEITADIRRILRREADPRIMHAAGDLLLRVLLNVISAPRTNPICECVELSIQTHGEMSCTAEL